MDEIFDELVRLGVGEVKIEYSGSGDEGFINDVTATGLGGDSDLEISVGDLHGSLENWAYGVLEEHHPGWEINEGSDGNIVLNVSTRKATLNYNENIVAQRSETQELSVD